MVSNLGAPCSKTRPAMSLTKRSEKSSADRTCVGWATGVAAAPNGDPQASCCLKGSLLRRNSRSSLV